MSAPAGQCPAGQIRVVVADDEQLSAVPRRFGENGQLTHRHVLVVAEAGNGPAAVAAVRRHRTDVVLMDVQMPGGDGIAATGAVRALPQAPRCWC